MALTDSFPTQDAGGLSITDTRRVMSGLVARSADGSPRPGLFPTGDSPLVSGRASMGYNVAPFIAATSRLNTGVELVANDASMVVNTTAAPASNSRIDVIWVRSRFVQHADGSNLPELGVTQGVPAAVPSKPSIPAGALELATAEILSTTTTTATAVITQTYPYTAAAGGVVPFRNLTDLNAWDAVDGSLARDASTGTVMHRQGGSWNRLNNGLNLVAAGNLSGANTDIDGVFSAAFTNYVIELDTDTIAPKAALFAQLRRSGVVEASGYFAEILFAAGTSVSAADQRSQARWQLLTNTGDVTKVRMELANPGHTRRTTGLLQSMSWDTAVGPNMHTTQAGLAHGSTSTFDGIRITTNNASSMTGRYRVYGVYSG